MLYDDWQQKALYLSVDHFFMAHSVASDTKIHNMHTCAVCTGACGLAKAWT